MKNRYTRIVLKQTGQQDLDVIRGKNNELIINVRSSKNDRFKTPPIPKGYRYVCGKWNDGFVIERKIDRSQFVWVPVGSLKSNGTLDGIHYSEKFGRRKWRMNNEYDSDKLYFDPLTKEFIEQVESVDKYQGFYVSRFNISRNKKTNKQQSVRNEYPLGGWNFFEIEDRASYFEKQDTVKSHLPYGSEYDSILEWIIESGARSEATVLGRSIEWGNYSENLLEITHHFKNAKGYKAKLEKTGSNTKWCANNIYDLSGNVSEWTQEHEDSLSRLYRNIKPYATIRGGNILTNFNYDRSVVKRIPVDKEKKSKVTGCRIALWIK